MPRIAIATCAELPDLDPDEARLREVLIDRGIAADAVIWDDASADWAAYDACIIRCTWDYSDRIDEYLPWADRVAGLTALFNPASIVRWNTDKHYLADLAAAGVPVVPTRFIEPGAPWDLDGLEEFVVKPTISCGSRDTMRYSTATSGSAPAEHVQRLLDDGRSVMVQPYLSAVDTIGESALMFIDGVFSHSIRKGQMLRLDTDSTRVVGLYAEERIDPRTPTDAELVVAERVLDAVPVPERLLYARVDLVPDADGNPVLLELELTEPSLFFNHDPSAVDRLADALLARIR